MIGVAYITQAAGPKRLFAWRHWLGSELTSHTKSKDRREFRVAVRIE